MNNVYIPLELLRDRNISSNAKILFGEITSECDANGYYNLDVKKISKKYNVGITSINDWIKCLSDNKYITIIKKDINIVESLKNKNLNGLGFGNKKCSWCGINTSVLHGHHYPIPKSKGGTEIVNICPNSHHEFHYYMSDKLIKLNLSTEEIKYIFNER